MQTLAGSYVPHLDLLITRPCHDKRDRCVFRNRRCLQNASSKIQDRRGRERTHLEPDKLAYSRHCVSRNEDRDLDDVVVASEFSFRSPSFDFNHTGGLLPRSVRHSPPPWVTRKTNMIHAARGEISPIRTWQRCPDPVFVRSDYLDAVAARIYAH